MGTGQKGREEWVALAEDSTRGVKPKRPLFVSNKQMKKKEVENCFSIFNYVYR